MRGMGLCGLFWDGEKIDEDCDGSQSPVERTLKIQFVTARRCKTVHLRSGTRAAISRPRKPRTRWDTPSRACFTAFHKWNGMSLRAYAQDKTLVGAFASFQTGTESEVTSTQRFSKRRNSSHQPKFRWKSPPLMPRDGLQSAGWPGRFHQRRRVEFQAPTQPAPC